MHALNSSGITENARRLGWIKDAKTDVTDWTRLVEAPHFTIQLASAGTGSYDGQQSTWTTTKD